MPGTLGGGGLTGAKPRLVVGLIASLLLAVLAAIPVRADTETELKAARARVAEVQSDLNRLTAAYEAAQTRLARTEAKIDEVGARVDLLRDRMQRIQDTLSTRVRQAYESGGAGTVELLLTSTSFSQFSDRVEFLGRLAQSDSDLLVQARVTGEQLRREEEDLEALSHEQVATVRSLENQKAAIAATFRRAQEAVAELQRQLEKERAVARAAAAARAESAPAPVFGGGPLQACPVGQPRSFVDSFGYPRPGGRTHQGIDLMAPYGTPIYAAQSGRFAQNSNTLGGISALVYASNGDYTYYAHMSSYAGVGDGSTVSAGTVIGHVGNTGDAQGGPYHLHFEYHPGGGSAVDPYSMLLAVC